MMLKIILLLAVVVPTAALIGGVMKHGHRGEASYGDVYSCKHREQSFITSGKTSCNISSWTFLVLAMSWPQTFCVEEHCPIPENVQSWTIHGLWPSCPEVEGPSFCNSSAVFDPEPVKDLLDDMNAHWPNLKNNTIYYDFWIHEWCKHGSCASALPALVGEHAYFSKALALRQLYDPYSVLQAAGIVPDDDVKYSAKNISSAIQQKYSVKPFIGCIKINHVYYLGELYMCMDKNFTLIDCDVPARGNCLEDQLLYPTLKHGK